MANRPSGNEQLQKFLNLARESESVDDEEAFDRALGMMRERKVCPECGHVFKGNGWDGIDAHWKSKHEDVMPYEEAWPLLKSGKYPA